jgi:hypothetical protein
MFINTYDLRLIIRQQKMALKNLGTKAVIAMVITAVMLTALSAALLTTSHTLTTTGSITPISAIGLSIYSDSGLTTPMTAITWGTLNPGGQTSVTIYLQNTGNIPENLTMSVSNWSPSNANTYLTCTWDPTVTPLAAGASTSATITLSASSSAPTTSYGFSLTISGTQ